MGNKSNPNIRINDFIREIDEALEDYRAIDRILNGQSERIRLRRRVAADTLMTSAVMWENFLDDWFIAAVHNSTDRFKRQVMAEFQSDSKTNKLDGLITGAEFSSFVIREYIDKKGRNLTFSEGKHLRAEAEKWLAEPFMQKAVNLAGRYEYIFLVTKIRNALAHRSPNAFSEMNRALSNIADIRLNYGKNKKSVEGVGTYLYSKENGMSHLELLLEKLKESAKELSFP